MYNILYEGWLIEMGRKKKPEITEGKLEKINKRRIVEDIMYQKGFIIF